MNISADGTKRLKGGLHIHTDKSDGRKSSAEATELYRSAGYDFIAITDHWVYNPGSRSDGITVLSGIEYDIGSDVQGGIFHIVGIGCSEDPGFTRSSLTMTGSLQQTQYVIDHINGTGGAAILAHPAWSMNRAGDILRLRGLAGIEIYNAISGMPWGRRADSSVILDMLAVDGFMLPLHAADDTHYYTEETGNCCIWAEVSETSEVSEALLIDAIKNGRLYASRGPLLEIERKHNTFYVTCSPVSSIVFQTGTPWIADRVTRADGLTHAEYTIKPSDLFVRIEAVDAEGKRAWSGYYSPEI